MRVVECEQGTIEWAEARRGIATASRFGDILTPKTMKLSDKARDYACELLAEHFVPPHYWLGDDLQTKAMAQGTRTEREARAYFELETNRPVQEVGFVLTDDGRFGCSPDGLVGNDAGLELKCPLHKTQISYLLDGTLPAKYRAQVHGALVVTGRSHWWFMSYAPGLAPLLVKVEPDDYTDKLRKALEDFWTLCSGMRNIIAQSSSSDPVAATREPFVSPY